MQGRCQWFQAAIRLVVLSAFCAGASAQETLQIVQPGPAEILYGSTDIVVAIPPSADIDRVLIYVDHYPHPVCRLTETPFTCEFDSGPMYQGRSIRALGLNASGEPVGEDTLVTLGFPEPVRTVQYVVPVPVVATRAGAEAPQLDASELGCSFGGVPCDILGAARMSFTEHQPLSVQVLVDVSPSVRQKRKELLESVESVLTAIPANADVLISEFSHVYRRLGEFTSDPSQLREQLQRLNVNGSGTCLFQAIRKSLHALARRPGHRMLFVISDGEDTCDSDIIYEPNAGKFLFRARPQALQDVMSQARQASVPLYLYRQKERWSQVITYSYRSYEGLAQETGGRLFSTGNLMGLEAAFEKLVQDVQSTWTVDVALPADARPGRTRRLLLTTSDLQLRYPEYWDPETMQGRRVAQLRSEIGSARFEAARQLFHEPDPAVLRSLSRAARAEPDARIRGVELAGMVNISAHLLVHGELDEQEQALDTIDELFDMEGAPVTFLRPALEVYGKANRPKRMGRRAAGYLDRLK